MTLSSQVPFSIGQSQFHAFKSLSVLIFFRFSEFEIPRNIIYVFFFDSPLLPLVTSLPKFSKNYSGSPRQAISLLTNWFEEPIELQDLLHIVDGRCQLYGNHRYCGVL